MDTYEVKTLTYKKNINVAVPGSKSITNRALMLAAMSDGICRLNGVLFSDDSRAFLDCLISLGFEVLIDEENKTVTIKGENGNVPNQGATINVRSAGTAARFMTVFLAVAGGDYVLNSSEQMKKRPMKELLDSLIEKGVNIKYLEKEGHFPLEIHSKGIKLEKIEIDTTTSSQYASALLMASVMNGMTIELKGNRINGSYIKITTNMMKQFGIDFVKNENIYSIRPQKYSCSEYFVEPDMSAACYFYAMALVLRSKAKVQGIHSNSMQGDIKFLHTLEKFGCNINDTIDGIEIDATKIDEYGGIDIDMSDFSDQALTMSALAVFANTPTRIRNIGHIRSQESDRVQVMANELGKVGCKVEILEKNGSTDVVIYPGVLHGAEIDTYNDHRVAMSYSILGLVIPKIIIKNPMCCKKTFENYFEILDEITK